MKKKFLSKILISVIMLGIFMLPIAPSIKTNSENFTAKINLNKINAQETPTTTKAPVLQEAADETTANGISLNCGVSNIGGCVAWLFWIIFRVVAWIVQLAASFLDYMVYYSINSSSYDNAFVAHGWSAVRDIANMFFIIALLYVAIKTILGLNVTDNKKMIGYVIVVALLLNFSLFTTKVVIDGTNILAKVFYNNAPNINQNGVDISEKKDGGEKSISLALIKTYNPQKMMTQDLYNKKGGVATFIFLVVVSTAIILYTAYMFFAVALLFVSRVASLWILMIFSPIAFASYTVPFNIPGFGHKEWWNELLKNAFLAPIFIFFLYIIAVFASFLNNLVSYPPGGSSTIIQNIMSIIIPFIILFVLLMKSKELAVKYSGEMGQAFIKGGQMIGGLALGAVTGGAAMLGTKAVGGFAASQLAKNAENWKEKAKESGFGGWAARMKLRTADYGSKATFDARQTGLGKQFTKTTGMNLQSAALVGLGAKTGGFKGMESRIADKIVKGSEIYKTKMTDAQVKEWAEKNNKRDKNGNLYTSAAQLNNDRLRAYKNNIGQFGLLGSLVYSSNPPVDKDNYKNSKEYKEWLKNKKEGDVEPSADEFVSEINKKRTDARGMTKMMVGAIGSVIASMSTGGAGILTGGAVTGNKAMERHFGEKEASKRLDKVITGGEKIDKEASLIRDRKKEIETTRARMKENYDSIMKAAGSTDKAEVEKYISRTFEELKTSMEEISSQVKSKREKILEFENQISEINSDSKLDVIQKSKKIADLGLNDKITKFKDEERALKASYASKMTEFTSINEAKNKSQKESELLGEETRLNTRAAEVHHKEEENYKTTEIKKPEGANFSIPSGGGGGHKEEKHDDHAASSGGHSGGDSHGGGHSGGHDKGGHGGH